MIFRQLLWRRRSRVRFNYVGIIYPIFVWQCSVTLRDTVLLPELFIRLRKLIGIESCSRLARSARSARFQSIPIFRYRIVSRKYYDIETILGPK